MVAIILGADNGFFYAGQVMHFSSPFTVFLIYHKQSFTYQLNKNVFLLHVIWKISKIFLRFNIHDFTTVNYALQDP